MKHTSLHLTSLESQYLHYSTSRCATAIKPGCMWSRVTSETSPKDISLHCGRMPSPLRIGLTHNHHFYTGLAFTAVFALDSHAIAVLVFTLVSHVIALLRAIACTITPAAQIASCLHCTHAPLDAPTSTHNLLATRRLVCARDLFFAKHEGSCAHTGGVHLFVAFRFSNSLLPPTTTSH